MNRLKFLTIIFSTFLFFVASKVEGVQEVTATNELLLELKNTSNLHDGDSLIHILLDQSDNRPWLLPYYHFKISEFYYKVNKDSIAIAYLLKAYSQVTEIPDSLNFHKFLIYNNLGVMLASKSDFDSARWSYNLAMEYLDTELYKSEASKLYIRLGHLAFDAYNNPNLAIEFYDKARKLRAFSEDTIGLDYHTTFGYGRYHFNNGRYDSAKMEFQKLLDLGTVATGKYKVEILNLSYSYLANIAYDTEDYRGALYYDLLSLKQEQKLGHPHNMIASYNNLGDDYFLINKPDSALYYYQLALELSEELNSADRKVEVLGNLHEYYFNIGQQEKAYEFLLERSNIYDTLVRHRADTKYNELLRTYESEKQEKEINKQKDEIELLTAREELSNARLMIVSIVVITLLVAGFLIARYRLRLRDLKEQELIAVSNFKEAMTGMIAHDLKNPLGIILGTEAEKPATRQMASQMLNLVNNMLDVHKFENTEVILDASKLSLTSIVNDAMEQVRPLLSEKNIQVDILIGSDNGVVADYDYLLRVFVNLFTNSIKYSPNNSLIQVNGVVTDNGKIEVSVTDQGSGISRENLNKIFESYEQIDPKKSGGIGSTGLGLAFCQLALRAHDTEIKVDSEVGIGTTFKFQLRIAESLQMNESQKVSHTFTMSEQERNIIISKMPELRSMKLHQAFAIEEILENIEMDNQNLNNWVQQVIDAAYSNNQIHYNELLDLVDKKK